MKLSVYKASAGSGKTFTLTIEYIKHLIENPKSYRNIIAVTFTNKATAEMKERIISQLYGISINDPQSLPYFNKIKTDLSLSDKEIQSKANEALHYIIHDYNQFYIETIDSFFQKVMRNLARELELNPNINIELDSNKVLDETVDSLLEKLKPNSIVISWINNYINEKIQENKSWNVSKEIKEFGTNILNEEYIKKGEKLREQIKDVSTITAYKKELRALEKAATEEVKEQVQEFKKIISSHNLEENDFKRYILSYFNKLENGSLDEKNRNKTVNDCLENPEAWTTKTNPKKEEVKQLATTHLIPFLNKLEEMRHTNNYIVNSCNLSAQHLNQLQLLSYIGKEMRMLNKELNRFLLSDTNALLHQLVQEDDSSFIFEKIGSNIAHIMIDEFQDTSVMQWNNFKILLLEGLANGFDSLIVGDVKQSIYRWRNGDWRILNNLKGQINGFPIEENTLKINRRSEGNIINFNNHIFRAIINQLNEKHKVDYGEECEELTNAYSDVEQESPKTVSKGYVKASFIDKKEDYINKTIEELGQAIVELIGKGVLQKDIAILVRKNKLIPDIADYLTKNLNLNVVSDEAFRLKASSSINIIIKTLELLTDPENKVAKVLIAQEYQNNILNQPISLESLIECEELELYLPKEFIEKRDKLLLMPLYEAIEEIFIIFNLKKIENQEAYIFTFFDAVTNYLETNSSEIDAFLTFWNESLCDKTIPSGEVDGIRILSIHKSKGLEFHTVMIPFCDWKLENETAHMIWCSSEQEPFDKLDIIPINYSAKMKESVFKQNHFNENLQLWVDNLNVLYVAFTRPEKNLFIWGKAESSNTISELLEGALPTFKEMKEINESDSEKNICYEYGEICISEKTESNKETHNKLLQKNDVLKVKLYSHQPDVIEFKQSNKSADFIKGVDEEEHKYIDRGKLLHHVFSIIKTEKDIDNAIEQLLFDGIITDEKQENEIKEVVEKAFDNEQVKEWYSDKWRTFNECDIIYQENGVARIKRPDRVMMTEDEVVIVDFKFGEVNKKYNHQVKEYINLLSKMNYSNISGYLWYVDKNEIVKV